MNNAIKKGSFKIQENFYMNFYKNENGGGVHYLIPNKTLLEGEITIINITPKQVRFSLKLEVRNEENEVLKKKEYINQIRKIQNNNTFEYPKDALKDFKTFFKNALICNQIVLGLSKFINPKLFISIRPKTSFRRNKAVLKISNWFLECKYNPKYKYCKDRINRLYDEEF